MKPTIQTKLFVQITFYLGVIVLLLFLALLAHEVYEVVEEGEPWHEEIFEIATLIAACLGIFFGVSGMIIFVLSRRVLGPLHHMADTAEQIIAGGLHERIPGPFPDHEIGTLAKALNHAFDRYHNVIERLENFTSDASHQLLTPLTRMQSSGDVSLSKTRSDAEYRETILDMLNEVDNLTCTVDQLLALSRLETPEVRSAFTRVEVSDLLEQVVERYDVLAKDRDITLELVCDQLCAIQGNPDLLSQAIGNLLDNALCAAPDGGQVRVVAEKKDDGMMHIMLTDDGPGIASEFRTKIFDRFSRTPQSSYEGSGLGLAIARDIAEIHGGTLHLVSADPGATCFDISLPAE